MIERLHYSPELKNRLGANNPESDVVLNPRFNPWREHIEEVLGCYISEDLRQRFSSRKGYEGISSEDVLTYRKGAFLELYERCKAHAAENSHPIEANKVILMVHPFFIYLCSMHNITSDEHKKQASEYLDRIMKLFGMQLPREKAGIIVFDSVHHYAAATSLLLEQGRIDAVYFTEHAKGTLVERDGFGKLGNQIFFVGGIYNGDNDQGRCVSHASGEVRRIVPFKKQIWAIRNLIMNCPINEDVNLLDPRKINSWNGQFPESQITTLDALVEELEGKNG